MSNGRAIYLRVGSRDHGANMLPHTYVQIGLRFVAERAWLVLPWRKKGGGAINSRSQLGVMITERLILMCTTGIAAEPEGGLGVQGENTVKMR